MSQKKNILILPRWYPNKTDIQLGTFIQKQAILMKDDFNVFVIYVQGDPNLQTKQEFIEHTDKGIHERIVYFKQATGPFRKVINARRYKMSQLAAFRNWDIAVDCCHVHVPYRSAFLALELKRKGIPFVITEHWSGHLNGEYQQKNPADKSIYKQVLSKANRLATVSELLRKKFKENTGFDSVVIPNLIELHEAPAVKASSQNIDVLSVSDLVDDVKNVTGLLMAFKEAQHNNPLLKLTIIGGGPDEQLVQELITEFNMQDFVTLKGRLPHNEVLKAYHHCDFYICNSNFETFGMTVAEALLASKPVISTKCGGPEEFIHASNGRLVNTQSVSELSSAISNMAAEYKNYNAAEIKSEISAKFGAAAIRKQIAEFYNTAMNG